MKTFIKSVVVIFITLFTSNLSTAQSKNLKTVDVKVYGNCGMCKKTIEKAGNIKGISKTEWSTETSMAKITIDSIKISVDEVLQRIAAVGYDSDKFRAPDAVYDNLHGCCQYDRPAKKEY
ncbi:MAG: heavy-metal-associated domain-containing protein [Saprospiraceae bacterium]|nr:heavy-metal-associated domain-containing protein [Saprospiraceae bacterium]